MLVFLYCILVYACILLYSMCRYEVKGCEVVWAIKDHSIGHTFFDEGAATFFLPHLESSTAHAEGEGPAGKEAVTEVSPLKRARYALDRGVATKEPEYTGLGVGETVVGGALGPDWHSDLKMTGKAFDEVGCHMIVM